MKVTSYLIKYEKLIKEANIVNTTYKDKILLTSQVLKVELINETKIVIMNMFKNNKIYKALN